MPECCLSGPVAALCSVTGIGSGGSAIAYVWQNRDYYLEYLGDDQIDAVANFVKDRKHKAEKCVRAGEEFLQVPSTAVSSSSSSWEPPNDTESSLDADEDKSCEAQRSSANESQPPTLATPQSSSSAMESESAPLGPPCVLGPPGTCVPEIKPQSILIDAQHCSANKSQPTTPTTCGTSGDEKIDEIVLECTQLGEYLKEVKHKVCDKGNEVLRDIGQIGGDNGLMGGAVCSVASSSSESPKLLEAGESLVLHPQHSQHLKLEAQRCSANKSQPTTSTTRGTSGTPRSSANKTQVQRLRTDCMQQMARLADDPKSDMYLLVTPDLTPRTASATSGPRNTMDPEANDTMSKWICPHCDEPNKADREKCNNCFARKPPIQAACGETKKPEDVPPQEEVPSSTFSKVLAIPKTILAYVFGW